MTRAETYGVACLLWFVVAVIATTPIVQAKDSAEIDALLGKAITAYANGRWAAAQTNLLSAMTSSSLNDAERKLLKDMLQQVSWKQKTAKIDNLLRQARKAEQARNWQLALTLYQQTAAIDGYVKAAVVGIKKTTPYVEAAKYLSDYLANPRDIFSAKRRKNARRLLAAIKEYGISDAKIAKDSKLLRERIHAAEIPQRVRLTSDGKSEITIYQTGALGKFSQKDLTLKPGKYVAVAKCRSYKDFRLEFWVIPERDNRFGIRCVERIAN